MIGMASPHKTLTGKVKKGKSSPKNGFHNKIRLILNEAEREYLHGVMKEYFLTQKLEKFLKCLLSILDTPVKLDLLKDIRYFIPRQHLKEYDKKVPYHKMAHPFMPIGKLPATLKQKPAELNEKLRRYHSLESLKQPPFKTYLKVSPTHVIPEGPIVTLSLTKTAEDALGFCIRGGSEHGLGIFISDVEQGSPADIAGFKVGDQLMEVNGTSFEHLASSKAAKLLTLSNKLQVLARRTGKIPSFKYARERTSWYDGKNQKIVPGTLEDHGVIHKPPGVRSSSKERQIHLANPQMKGNLGFNIRGGSEYGLGIYVSRVDKGGFAELQGLRVGDQILKVRGHDLDKVSHTAAVDYLRKQTGLLLTVLRLHKYPVYKEIYAEYSWMDKDGLISKTRMPSPEPEPPALIDDDQPSYTEFPRDSVVGPPVQTEDLPDISSPTRNLFTQSRRLSAGIYLPQSTPDIYAASVREATPSVGSEEEPASPLVPGRVGDFVLIGQSEDDILSNQDINQNVGPDLDRHELSPSGLNRAESEHSVDNSSDVTMETSTSIPNADSSWDDIELPIFSMRNVKSIQTLRVRGEKDVRRMPLPGRNEEQKPKKSRSFKDILFGKAKSKDGSDTEEKSGSRSSKSRIRRTLSSISFGSSRSKKGDKQAESQAATVQVVSSTEQTRQQEEAAWQASLNMLEKKAIRLVSRDECTTLIKHVHKYREQGDIEAMVIPLFVILDTPEKSLLLRDVRCCVRTADLSRFDMMVMPHELHAYEEIAAKAAAEQELGSDDLLPPKKTLLAPIPDSRGGFKLASKETYDKVKHQQELQEREKRDRLARVQKEWKRSSNLVRHAIAFSNLRILANDEDIITAPADSSLCDFEIRRPRSNSRVYTAIRHYNALSAQNSFDSSNGNSGSISSQSSENTDRSNIVEQGMEMRSASSNQLTVPQEYGSSFLSLSFNSDNIQQETMGKATDSQNQSAFWDMPYKSAMSSGDSNKAQRTYGENEDYTNVIRISPAPSTDTNTNVIRISPAKSSDTAAHVMEMSPSSSSDNVTDVINLSPAKSSNSNGDFIRLSPTKSSDNETDVSRLSPAKSLDSEPGVLAQLRAAYGHGEAATISSADGLTTDESVVLSASPDLDTSTNYQWSSVVNGSSEVKRSQYHSSVFVKDSPKTAIKQENYKPTDFTDFTTKTHAQEVTISETDETGNTEIYSLAAMPNFAIGHMGKRHVVTVPLDPGDVADPKRGSLSRDSQGTHSKMSDPDRGRRYSTVSATASASSGEVVDSLLSLVEMEGAKEGSKQTIQIPAEYANDTELMTLIQDAVGQPGPAKNRISCTTLDFSPPEGNNHAVSQSADTAGKRQYSTVTGESQADGMASYEPSPAHTESTRISLMSMESFSVNTKQSRAQEQRRLMMNGLDFTEAVPQLPSIDERVSTDANSTHRDGDSPTEGILSLRSVQKKRPSIYRSVVNKPPSLISLNLTNEDEEVASSSAQHPQTSDEDVKKHKGRKKNKKEHEPSAASLSTTSSYQDFLDRMADPTLNFSKGVFSKPKQPGRPSIDSSSAFSWGSDMQSVRGSRKDYVTFEPDPLSAAVSIASTESPGSDWFEPEEEAHIHRNQQVTAIVHNPDTVSVDSVAAPRPADDTSLQLLAPGAIKVVLSKAISPLGISISGGSDSSVQPRIKIQNVVPGGAAAADGTLKPGMQLLAVDGTNLDGATHSEAVSIIRKSYLNKSWPHMVLVVKV